MGVLLKRTQMRASGALRRASKIRPVRAEPFSNYDSPVFRPQSIFRASTGSVISCALESGILRLYEQGRFISHLRGTGWPRLWPVAAGLMGRERPLR